MNLQFWQYFHAALTLDQNDSVMRVIIGKETPNLLLKKFCTSPAKSDKHMSIFVKSYHFQISKKKESCKMQINKKVKYQQGAHFLKNMILSYLKVTKPLLITSRAIQMFV